MFDVVYEVFIIDGSFFYFIYEVEGVRECVIEFCFFFKNVGFIGICCVLCVIFKIFKGKVVDGFDVELWRLWNCCYFIKFNGVFYIV